MMRLYPPAMRLPRLEPGLHFGGWNQGASTIEFAFILPIFFTLLLLIFESAKYVFVMVQLEHILLNVAKQAKTYQRLDVEQNMRNLAENLNYSLIDPAELSLAVQSSPDLNGILVAPDPGLGGAGDVVRYELRYEHAFFGGFGSQAWEPLTLRLVEMNRNELRL